METTEKLVKKAQKGDKAAFVDLMERHKLSMSRAAMAILHNEEDTADAVQETALAAFTKLRTLREPKYFKTWLIRILIHNCYDLLRGQQRNVSLDLLPDRDWGTGRVEERDNIIDIRESLNSLAENDRLVLTLFYLDDLSVRDISQLLSVKEATVRTRLHRGRERFRKAYCEREETYCEASER